MPKLQSSSATGFVQQLNTKQRMLQVSGTPSETHPTWKEKKSLQWQLTNTDKAIAGVY